MAKTAATPGGESETLIFVAHGGEVTILWFICAGIIGVMGSRKFGLERLILKKEIL